MYFLLALGMFVYLFTKISADSSRGKRYEQNRAVAKTDADNFIAKYVTSYENVKRIESLIYTGTDSSITELANELEKVIGIVPTNSMLVMGYLVINGKVPEMSYIYKTNSPFLGRHDSFYRELRPWSSYSVEEMRQARVKFLHWYDKTAQENGIDYPLMAARKVKDDNGNMHSHVESVQKFDETDGIPIYELSLFWWPIRLHVPELLGVV